LSSFSPSSVAEFARTAIAAPISHGNVIWVLGGGVAAAASRWPGLATAHLYQGRDLAATTDYRTVLAAILEHHPPRRPRARADFPRPSAGAVNLNGMLALVGLGKG
jgi:uncharacterized protein (DUF1501 family)